MKAWSEIFRGIEWIKGKNGKGPYVILVTCHSHDLTDKREGDGTLILFTLRDIYIPFVY